MALCNFTLLTLTCHCYLRSCQNHTKKTWIFQAPVAPAPAAPAMKKLLFCSTFILPCIFFVFLFLPGSVDATWRISSSSLRMCARQDCFVFKRSQVVFYFNFSCSRHVSKSANLIGWIVFDVARQTKKTNPRHFFLNDAFTRRCAHSHWCPLFSHEALNVGEYCVQNSSQCVRALRLVTPDLKLNEF